MFDKKIHKQNADWLSIILQGLFGALLGGIAGGLLVMHRATRFMARDPESSLIMVIGCIVAGAGLFMRRGDSLLVSTHVIPPMPIRHSILSVILSISLVVIGVATTAFGIGRFFYLPHQSS